MIVQGSGTMAVEATLGSAIPREGAKVLIADAGAYGARMIEMANYMDIPTASVAGLEPKGSENSLICFHLYTFVQQQYNVIK